MKDPLNIIPILQDWARSQDFVFRLWIYGSYLRDDFRPDSDIDLAIEVLQNHEDAYTRYYGNKMDWTENLQQFLPRRPHFSYYQGDTIKEINKCGYLVYDCRKDYHKDKAKPSSNSISKDQNPEV